MKLIKSYAVPRYKVDLFDSIKGYLIVYETYTGKQHSEFIADYNTASFMFDLKVDELEGN